MVSIMTITCVQCRKAICEKVMPRGLNEDMLARRMAERNAVRLSCSHYRHVTCTDPFVCPECGMVLRRYGTFVSRAEHEQAVRERMPTLCAQFRQDLEPEFQQLHQYYVPKQRSNNYINS